MPPSSLRIIGHGDGMGNGTLVSELAALRAASERGASSRYAEAADEAASNKTAPVSTPLA